MSCSLGFSRPSFSATFAPAFFSVDWSYAEAIHDLLERVDVLLDLLGDAGEKVLVRGAEVLVGEAPGEV